MTKTKRIFFSIAICAILGSFFIASPIARSFAPSMHFHGATSVPVLSDSLQRDFSRQVQSTESSDHVSIRFIERPLPFYKSGEDCTIMLVQDNPSSDIAVVDMALRFKCVSNGWVYRTNYETVGLPPGLSPAAILFTGGMPGWLLKKHANKMEILLRQGRRKWVSDSAKIQWVGFKFFGITPSGSLPPAWPQGTPQPLTQESPMQGYGNRGLGPSALFEVRLAGPDGNRVNLSVSPPPGP